MIKGAIFDADGTLLDSMHIWDEVGERFLRSKGKMPEADLYKILFPMTLEESSVYLKMHYALDESPKEIKEGVLSVIDGFYRREVGLKAGVKDYLAYLHQNGIRMSVATTSDKGQIEAAFIRLGIRKYFREIFTCSELQTNKREPTVYLKAAEALDVNPSETVVFEDVIYAVKTAKKAGFFTVAVEDASSLDSREEIKEAADLYIRDFTDSSLRTI